jgi:hypothetical protein
MTGHIYGRVSPVIQRLPRRPPGLRTYSPTAHRNRNVTLRRGLGKTVILPLSSPRSAGVAVLAIKFPSTCYLGKQAILDDTDTIHRYRAPTSRAPVLIKMPAHLPHSNLGCSHRLAESEPLAKMGPTSGGVEPVIS